MGPQEANTSTDDVEVRARFSSEVKRPLTGGVFVAADLPVGELGRELFVFF
jgi:hypothetical protein